MDTKRYQPHADPHLVVCVDCSKPDEPAVIPLNAVPAHDLWHTLPDVPGPVPVSAPWPRLKGAAK